jgi:hypothetical protein
MSKKISVVLKVACLSSLLFAGRLQAQSLRVTSYIPQADIINAGSLFDIMGDRIKLLSPGTFSIRFDNLARQSVTVVINIEAYVTLDEDHERMWLYKAQSRPFVIGTEGRTFTALDTRDGGSDINFPSPEKNTPCIDKVKDRVTSPAGGGRVPSGTYEVSMRLTVVQIGTQIVSENIPVTIPPVVVSNPSITDLTSPALNGYEYPTLFPVFSWNSDTRSVTLTVNALQDGQSLEDAAQSSDNYLKLNIDRQSSGNLSSFQYPLSGASRPGVEIVTGPRPLEYGKSYVLVLEGNRTSIETQIAPLRTIRSFRVAYAPNSGPVAMRIQLHGAVINATAFRLDLIAYLRRVMLQTVTVDGIEYPADQLSTLLSRFEVQAVESE